MFLDTSIEIERLAALDDLAITGTPAEAHFDAVCRLACDLFGAPLALVSIVEADRQWFKAKCGTDLSESPRAGSFCTHTIGSDEVFVVEDAAVDPRFATSALVQGGPGIRFYAGAPLVLRPGVRIGALCVKDMVPRSFSGEQRRQLRDLAEIVVAHLRLHESRCASEVESCALRAAQDAQREAERAVRASEASYRLLADNATDMVVRRSAANIRTYVSPSAYELLGFTPEEFLSIPLSQTVHPEDARASERLMSDLLSGRIDQCRVTHRNQHKDGRWIWVEANCRLVRDETGAPVEVISTVRDISERKAAEDALRLSEERLSLALDSGSDGLWDWDIASGAIRFSGEYLQTLGYEPGEVQHHIRNWSRIVHPDDAAEALRLMTEALKGHAPLYESEYRMRTRTGDYRWTLSRGKVVTRDEAGRALRMVGTYIDITRRKEAERQIAHLATHDPLTGLPNRVLFRDRLDLASAHARRRGDHFTVLACDLDRFKIVNDTRGHPAGDAVLRVVADRLRTVVRDGDTVARLGADEFAVILAGSGDPRDVSGMAQRMIDTVGQPIDLGGEAVGVGLSVGVAFGGIDCTDADNLFKNADIALYRAKTAGRNTYSFYEPGMDAVIAERNRLERDLREAVRNGGFTLHYQPIVRLGDDAVGGFEALMRWPHETRGMVSPAEFIPLAEETGLIVPLGEWALHEACREAAGWPGDVRVAVNVSPVQFRRPGLEQAVVGALAGSGLALGRLELEITESVLMDDSEAAIACLHRLRGLGVRIALDDFGTGFSSLSYLRRFPFQKIKIDRSFVREIHNPDTAAIVRAVVGIGARLGATITAEGVETGEQLACVREVGCSEVQGYLFGRPMPAGEAVLFARNGRGRAAA